MILNFMKRFFFFSPLVRPGVAAGRVSCLAAVLLMSGLPVSAEMIHRWSFSETSGTTVEDDIGDAHGQIVVLGGGGGFQRNGRRVRLDGGARASADYVVLPGSVFDGLTEVSIE
ncbi:MAG TPA: hypothetical protein VLD18_04410, partial [Verrucomicrobiae bacterium]|nr:hypothetical protein [Verrucomicrobiae bacterium]